MVNQKLKTIASLVKKEDRVIDVGCDHAYLAIYLKEQKLCQVIYASDISENAVKVAKENIKKSKTDIEVYLSDGFKNIQNKKINTAIISGMGTNTILSILKDAPNSIEKYIISSNNNHEELRTMLLKKGLFLKKELVIEENKKYYPIMLFTKEKEQITKLELKYGKSKNKEYFIYLLEKEKEILKQIGKAKLRARLKHKRKIKELKKLI